MLIRSQAPALPEKVQRLFLYGSTVLTIGWEAPCPYLVHEKGDDIVHAPMKIEEYV
jgi:hypothetical protein